MSSNLKQELKAWEANFRAKHGTDPTKQDIKQEPDIGSFSSSELLVARELTSSSSSARKYKEYNKSKQAPPPPKPVPSNVFKTPTKPRSSRQAATATTPTLDPRGSLGDNPFLAKGAEKSSTDSKSNGTRYVLANSPSKLRALAAMHSTSGSPNRPSGSNWTNSSTSTSASTLVASSSSNKEQSKTSTSADPPAPVDFNRSPRKALNPFASPRKKEVVTVQPPSRGTTLFGDFEKLEREKLKKKRSRIKVKGGMGWGHATDALEWQNEGRDVGKMDADEVDEFFRAETGVQSTTKKTTLDPSFPVSTSSTSDSFALPSTTPLSLRPRDQDDDEMLGPSPVKPSFRKRTSSFGSDHSKPFKPLFDDTSTTSSSSLGQPIAKPVLFATSLRSTSITPEEQISRGGKRPLGTTTTVGLGKGKGKESDEMDAVLEDGDDDFYADALDAVEKELVGTSGRTKVKRKRTADTTSGRGKGKGKGKIKATKNRPRAEDEDMGGEEDDDDDDEVKIERDKNGGLLLDFRVDGTGESGEVRERVTIQTQSKRARRTQGNTISDEKGVADEEAGGGGGYEFESDDNAFIHDGISLLDRPPSRAIISSQPSTSIVRAQERSDHTHASLPAELASFLSLRASPQKFGTLAKDRQVAQLLGEPTAAVRQKRRGGLLELEDELEGERWDEQAGGNEEEGGDDDWDEEVDGWKQTGEAMDGYYSGDEKW
ncbi:uncharacterized protein JCM6883_006236 [Sporobolomyces salmoneus]|uniref:uncharacterized protein n=1 Tax=Sporobolomyces salmoneus TaxID=183962 RepID=UPI0031700689